MPTSLHPLRELARSVAPEILRLEIAKLSHEEADVLLHDWNIWARPEQLEPPGDWQSHLILAGRGWGKTATGSQWIRAQVKTLSEVNLIGATSDDAIRIMIEGPSGILKSCANFDRPKWVANKNCLFWPNGARSNVFTADRPDRLRGSNHESLWMDELASWRYRDAYDQAKLGLRIGVRPRALITTTPRATPLIKEIIKEASTHVTRGTTYDNRENLAKSFFDQIIKTYEGTRIGRQELNAEILDDNPGALWQSAQIDYLRVVRAPSSLKRVVIGVDPATTSKKNSDRTGIVVVGLGYDDHGYVIADRSLIGTPAEWAKVVSDAYYDFGADRVIAETNNGGDMVEAVLRTENKNLPYKAVHASRGKAIRAEPISAIYEQGRAHHIGFFPELEKEMCDFDPMIAPEKSPDRMDALVWAFTELFETSGLAFIAV